MGKALELPSQEELRRLFDYDPESGKLMRKDKRKGVIAGRVLGSASSSSNRYLRITVYRENYWAHRVVWKWMTGEDPNPYIDHIDGDGTNNRWDNLRLVTMSQNQFNRKPPVKGAEWIERLGKWRVRVGARDKRRHLGLFSTKAEALAVRQKYIEEAYRGGIVA